MRRFGITLIVLSIGSFFLHMVGMEFILLSWVDLWGQPVGWIIRGVLVLLGLVMAVLGGRNQ